MTYAEFLHRLAETPRTWELVPPSIACTTGDELIRCEDGTVCPLDVVVPEWRDAVSEPKWWHDVRNAADWAALKGFDEYPSVRGDLLKACGLQ